MPSPDPETAFIRVRRDVHARLGVAVAIAGPGCEQCDVASTLLIEAMDSRGTPHPENKPPDVATTAGKLVKKALKKPRDD